MSCSRCDDLCEDAPIASVEALSIRLARTRAALADGTIIETAQASPTSFAVTTAGGATPDFIMATFKCPNCGEGFRLVCESHRGEGGEWTYGWR